MASPQENVSMALFCDFENVALGVRDAKYEKFDIRPVLERLLVKGSIVVKKAYCDWDRYKGFKAAMHEASFELIEIPHVRQTGKNSADIRLVVDALDLCYTKSHVDTFVIISGDSDFSPLVSKLRENAKKVIGVGVKNSTSDLLVANCDEFIFYDDLVREQQRTLAKRESREASAAARRALDDERQPKEDLEKRRAKGIAIAVETFEALASERDDVGKIWASMLKSAIKRRRPDFSESYYGFRAFGNLLDEAQARGLLDVGRDEKSGAYVTRGAGRPVPAEAASLPPSANGAPSALPAAGETSDAQANAPASVDTEMLPPPARPRSVEPDEAPAGKPGASRGEARNRRRRAGDEAPQERQSVDAAHEPVSAPQGEAGALAPTTAAAPVAPQAGDDAPLAQATSAAVALQPDDSAAAAAPRRSGAGRRGRSRAARLAESVVASPEPQAALTAAASGTAAETPSPLSPATPVSDQAGTRSRARRRTADKPGVAAAPAAAPAEQARSAESAESTETLAPQGADPIAQAPVKPRRAATQGARRPRRRADAA